MKELIGFFYVYFLNTSNIRERGKKESNIGLQVQTHH